MPTLWHPRFSEANVLFREANVRRALDARMSALEKQLMDNSSQETKPFGSNLGRLVPERWLGGMREPIAYKWF